MSDASGKSVPSHNGDRHDSVVTAKDDAKHAFIHALDEAHWAKVRSHVRTSVTGFDGKNFDQRTARVENIVKKYNERAVKLATNNALRAGWAKEELVAPKRFTTA